MLATFSRSSGCGGVVGMLWVCCSMERTLIRTRWRWIDRYRFSGCCRLVGSNRETIQQWVNELRVPGFPWNIQAWSLDVT